MPKRGHSVPKAGRPPRSLPASNYPSHIDVPISRGSKLTVKMIGAVSSAVLETLVWWRIAMANFLATAAMFGFFSMRHPGLSLSFRSRLWRRAHAPSLRE